MNELTTRAKVYELEREMLQLPQVSIVPVHRFSPGVYAREITIPAGTLVTGEIHKYAQLNILSKGQMALITDTGRVDVEAPFTIVSPPGTKRAAYAFTECVWTTILHTNETDVEKIEDHFIAKSEQEYLEFKG